MKIINNFFVFFYLFSVVNCSSIYNVSYDYDRNANFIKLKTYNWLHIPEKDINGLDLKRIKNAVENELRDKGLSIELANPDVLISEHLIKKDKLNITDWGYGLHRRYGGPHDIMVYQYEEGTLILDVIDSESKDLIWRGSAKTDFDNAKTPEKRDLLIKELVQKIFYNFPPPNVR